MTIDARILLAGGTVPDLMSALQKGAQAGDMLAQMQEAKRMRPIMRERAQLENQMLQANIAKQQQVNSLGIGGQIQSSKTFNDGTVLYNTVRGPLVYAPGSTSPLVGEDAKIALTNAFNKEVELTGAKARAGALGRLETEREIKPEITALIEGEIDKQEVLQGSIDKALNVGDNISSIGRSLELLSQVNTGKPQQVLLSAKNMFGIEAADEGELQSLMGQVLVSGLKDSFGGAPSDAEQRAMREISAAFSQQGEVNRRLLNQGLGRIERSIRRGIRAAERKNDDFAAEELEMTLDRILDIKEMEFKRSAPVQQPAQNAEGFKLMSVRDK